VRSICASNPGPSFPRWRIGSRSVTVRRGAAVHGVAPGRLDTAAGPVHAERIILCPGDDLTTLFPDVLANAGVTRWKLQMMRLASPGYRLSTTILTDLGPVRYLGYATLPRRRCCRRCLPRIGHGASRSLPPGTMPPAPAM
jgi:hypothetical protein